MAVSDGLRAVGGGACVGVRARICENPRFIGIFLSLRRGRAAARCGASGSRDVGAGERGRAEEATPVIEPAFRFDGRVDADRQHLKHGLRQAARLHFAAGATSIVTLHNKKTRIDRPVNGEVSEQQYRDYDRQVEHHGMNPNRLIAFSAHQMGTCRMGADPKDAVVDGNHEVYGVKGLFVCDGSVFPSASGVNPMLSIMGLAHRASVGIKGRV